MKRYRFSRGLSGSTSCSRVKGSTTCRRTFAPAISGVSGSTIRIVAGPIPKCQSATRARVPAVEEFPARRFRKRMGQALVPQHAAETAASGFRKSHEPLARPACGRRTVPERGNPRLALMGTPRQNQAGCGGRWPEAAGGFRQLGLHRARDNKQSCRSTISAALEIGPCRPGTKQLPTPASKPSREKSGFLKGHFLTSAAAQVFGRGWRAAPATLPSRPAAVSGGSAFRRGPRPFPDLQQRARDSPAGGGRARRGRHREPPTSLGRR